MKNIYLLTSLVVPLWLITGCAPQKEKEDYFTEYETIIKDEDFRAGITTGNFVRLSAGNTYYEFENNNKDTLLVMVHGFSVPSYIWDSTYNAALNRGYSVLRYDTYGRGFSDNPDTSYDLTLYTNQLKELLDTLQISSPINLLGLSDGGRTISAFAAQYPGRVKNLIYVDAAGFETIDDESNNSSIVSEQEIQSFIQSERYANMASGQLGDFYDSIPFRGWDKKYKKMMRFKGFVRALLSSSKNRPDLEKMHRKISESPISVFAIWGAHDTVVKLEDVRFNLQDRIPSVNLFVIPEAGHLPHMEQTSLFNTILFDQIIRNIN